MPSALRHIASRLLLPALRLKSRLAGANGYRVLVFHDTPPDRLEALAESVETARAIGAVADPSTLEGAIAGAGSTESAGIKFVFTFDDGFAGNLAAARLLAKAGVKAVFFICPGLIDLAPDAQREGIARQIFDGRVSPQELPRDLRLLDWQEIRAIRDLGHDIGSHGMTHRRLCLLDGEHLAQEIEEPVTAFKREIGTGPDWYAYSFGDIASISAEALRRISGAYRFCRTGIRGTNTKAIDPFAIWADELNLGAPRAYRRLVLEGGLQFRYARARDDYRRLRDGP